MTELSAGLSTIQMRLSTGQAIAGTPTQLLDLVGLPIISVTNPAYGAVGDGVSDDTAPIQAALDSGAGIIFFPPGTYAVAGDGLFGASNQILMGSGAGATTIKLTAVPATAGSLLKFNSKSNFHVRDITFDFDNQSGGNLDSVIAALLSTDYSISYCEIIKHTRFGIANNSCIGFKINNNYIERDALSPNSNHAIWNGNNVGDSSGGEIVNNHCVNSSLFLRGFNFIIGENLVEGYGFGGGITSAGEVGTHDNKIINNTFSGGDGTDENGARPNGIENWGNETTIQGNDCFDNSGSGISNGGKRCTVDGNICYDNGITINSGGIVNRYQDATFNGSGSIYSGNISFNTLGAGGTQNYGYEDQSALITDCTVIGNNFNDNKLNPMNILTTDTVFYGPVLEASATFDPPNIAAAGTTTTTVTVTGAALGDIVEASFSLDSQGIMLSGYVSAADTVTTVFFNPTGGAIDLASGTLRVRSRKPINYAEF